MTSLRWRITFIVTVTVTVLMGFGGLSFSTFQRYSTVNEQMALSHSLVVETKALNPDKLDKKELKRLSEVAASLEPKHRREGLERILKSYEKARGWQMGEDRRLFVKNEKAYREYIQPLVPYLKKRLHYYGVICIFATLLCLGFVYRYSIKSIFDPMKDLSRKMTDFLHDKYTFKYSVPAPNEVGRLQASFNAMAQRVLSNMDELRSLDQAKSDFLSIASHELRTPLTSIKGSLSLLNEGVTGEIPEPAQNLVNIAENETNRLIRLINELLDLAKIEAGKFPLEKKWVPLSEIVNSSIEGIHGLAKKAEVQLVVENFASSEINADRDRIQQVITNLLSNAIKYSPKKKAVTLKVTIDDERGIVIEVKDQGKGIAPEDQELIFEQFRQVTGPQNPLVKGTGLGLAIAKALVQEHDGEIGVWSKPKEGSTFFFSLPEWRPIEEQTQTETGALAA